MLRVKLSDITRMSELTAATTLNGSTLTSLGNGQLLDNGLLPLTDVYTITLTSDSPDPITYPRLLLLPNTKRATRNNVDATRL